ncbi:MAG: hypothetical protein F4Y20_02575 [Acidobacteria bacterium]|nr:hypothetical protein [Acidobacteriota bacterium]MYH22162.1 hypothetical protein [Acidobacteriota bacterium]MYK80659.1 hypothetical protein [Acidobacteriota bacterium]
MHDCHTDILAFHDDEVTLPDPERTEMRERRNANRDRIKSGLERDGAPAASDFRSQGSYTHRTMVQQPDKDYDIDDGVFFQKGDLVKPSGADRTPREAKEMVRSAVHDPRFAREPEVRTNCVRVHYEKGYHVDLPVYRVIESTDLLGNRTTRHELASAEWKESDPQAVTKWFFDNNKARSPDQSNGGQLRRQVRLLKAFARSRKSWRDRIATGFTITTLIVEECYRANGEREDCSLHDTMKAMRDRLHWNRRVMHPVVRGEELTRGPDDARTGFLLEKLTWALGKLEVLHRVDCTRKEALAAWGAVFDTSFFADRGDGTKESGTPPLVFPAGSDRPAPWEPFDRRGGGRYA